MDDIGRNVGHRVRMATLLMAAVILAACGDAPFGSLGERSSDWIGEPTVVTTTTVPTTVPVVIGAERLKWFNDDIGGEFLDDPDALRSAIFARRGGDLFVQASREELVALLPDVAFPSSAPYLSEYVTSQIVFDNDGTLANDPVAAFGIWSSEPYSRSRSVAQMVVLRVSLDAVAAAELAEPGAEISCDRFSDRTTESCEIIEIGGSPVWLLESSSGRTLVWYGEPYRYELFGRGFVARAALEEMVLGMGPLVELEEPAG